MRLTWRDSLFDGIFVLYVAAIERHVHRLMRDWKQSTCQTQTIVLSIKFSRNNLIPIGTKNWSLACTLLADQIQQHLRIKPFLSEWIPAKIHSFIVLHIQKHIRSKTFNFIPSSATKNWKINDARTCSQHKVGPCHCRSDCCGSANDFVQQWRRAGLQ